MTLAHDGQSDLYARMCAAVPLVPLGARVNTRRARTSAGRVVHG